MTVRSAPARYDRAAIARFSVLHLGVLAVFLYPPSVNHLLWMAASYSIRMFGVTAGYHRYFSHRSYRLGRFAQFLMAFLAQTSGQKGVLWWAAQHCLHHKHADGEQDIHSPARDGFWWSHIGWILSDQHDTYDSRKVADLARYPELRWLDRFHWVPVLSFMLFTLLAGGMGAFVWGYIVSSVLLYHGTFAINSLAHVFGSCRFNTPDYSRNNWLLALISFGEGWHNNRIRQSNPTLDGLGELGY